MIKPRLRIKLVPPYPEPLLLARGIKHRRDGPDHWEVKVTYTSSEGAMDIQRFKSMDKAKALYKAYAYIQEKYEAGLPVEKEPEPEQWPKGYTPAMEVLPEEFYIPEPSPKWSFWNWFK